MNKETISLLNSLIETVKDGEQGFKTAAEGLTSPDLKAKFLQYSRERGQMAGELQAEVRRLGGDPEHSGSMSGAMHRGWLDIKSAITGKDDHAIVAEAERGEDVAKSAFENALKEVHARARRCWCSGWRRASVRLTMTFETFATARRS